MKLELVAKQATVLTPKLLNAIEILQMNSQELIEYASVAMEENPMLESETVVQTLEMPIVFGEFSRSWVSRQGTEDYRDEDEKSRVPDMSEEYEETLFASLRDQLLYLGIEPPLLSVCLLLAVSLDENGWLCDSIEELSESSGYSKELLCDALKILQSLEPAGVGAQNLSQCLRLQLERHYPKEILACELADNHLDAVSRLRYRSIASKTNTSLAEVEEACRLIRSLEPRPGRAYARNDRTSYIMPDVIVSQSDESFEVKINSHTMPPLGISSYYSALLSKSDDTELRAYLSSKMREAQWLISTLEQRNRTICGCVASLVRIQERFFREGKGLVPMSLLDIALENGVHESTVSRAMRGKHIQCRWGVYPMSYFFSRAFTTEDGTNSASPDFVKSMMRGIIEGEDKRNPLSDQKLSEAIMERGCIVSRRTVAKYREELGIPSAAGRKR